MPKRWTGNRWADVPSMAFSDKLLTRLDNQLLRMQHRQVDLTKVPFTHEELRDLFIDPNQHETLTRAYRLVGAVAPIQNLYHRWVVPLPAYWRAAQLPMEMTVMFDWRAGEEGFFVPLQGSSMSRPAPLAAEAPARAEFLRLIEDVTDITYRFSMARWVLNKLDFMCTTPAQLRYVWPCIVPLLRSVNESKLAREIETPSARAGQNVKVDYTLVTSQMLQATNATVARHFLIDADQEPAKLPISYGFIDEFQYR